MSDKNTWPFSRPEWFSLPLALRQKWWNNTDYSRSEPSAKMLAEVRKALGRTK